LLISSDDSYNYWRDSFEHRLEFLAIMRSRAVRGEPLESSFK
jgi:hypothetical protein